MGRRARPRGARPAQPGNELTGVSSVCGFRGCGARRFGPFHLQSCSTASRTSAGAALASAAWPGRLLIPAAPAAAASRSDAPPSPVRGLAACGPVVGCSVVRGLPSPPSDSAYVILRFSVFYDDIISNGVGQTQTHPQRFFSGKLFTAPSTSEPSSPNRHQQRSSEPFFRAPTSRTPYHCATFRHGRHTSTVSCWHSVPFGPQRANMPRAVSRGATPRTPIPLHPSTTWPK